MILGAGKTARAVIRNLHENRVLAYEPVLCLDDDLGKSREPAKVCPLSGVSFKAKALAELHHIHYAIVAMPGISRVTAS
jgi:FlaA1/EpsC-like NDP-sugar epimerase